MYLSVIIHEQKNLLLLSLLVAERDDLEITLPCGK